MAIIGRESIINLTPTYDLGSGGAANALACGLAFGSMDPAVPGTIAVPSGKQWDGVMVNVKNTGEGSAFGYAVTMTSEQSNPSTEPVRPFIGRAISNTSIQGRVALGRRAGARVWRAGEEPDVPWVLSHAPRHAHLDGFDLHANVAVPAGERPRLEQLCRYLLRPAVSQDRLQNGVGGRHAPSALRAIRAGGAERSHPVGVGLEGSGTSEKGPLCRLCSQHIAPSSIVNREK